MAPCKTYQGSFNTFIGSAAGYDNKTGDGNVFIGFWAGFGLRETGSNRLYIANSDMPSPLVYGEFDNNLLRVNGKLEFSSGYALSDARYKTDSEGYKSVAYHEIVPVLIGAVQEQKAMIDINSEILEAQQAEIDSLLQEVRGLMAARL